jgi:amino acid adenylation domain-containing protein
MIHRIIESFWKNSNRNAFCIQGEYYTYADLEKRVSAIISLIDLNKYSRGSECIGILEQNDIQTYASLLAVLISGNTYVVLNPHNPISRNQTIIRSTKLRLILSSVSNELLSDLPNDVNWYCTQDCKEGSRCSQRLVNEDQNAYIIFTSGSTGTPKGVPISHKNLNAFYKSYSALGFNLDEEDRMLQMFDLCFDVSVVSTLFPLTIGACVYTVPMEGIKYPHVYELLEDEEITFAAIPPSLLTFLQPYFEEIDFPKLKYLILTAEASNCDLIKRFGPSIPNASIVNLYGPTEATIYCMSYEYDPEKVKQHNGMMAIGKSFDQMDTIIVDQQDRILHAGEMGELCIAGLQLMEGYWEDPEKSAEVFVEIGTEMGPKRFYRSGDLCYVDRDGCTMYCGRKDYQVQVNGFRVELSEIENTVRKYYDEGSNVVIPKTNSLGNTELHLFLEKFSGDKEDVASFLNEHLPPYMCPKKIHLQSNFPLNNSGKIDRKKLQSII